MLVKHVSERPTRQGRRSVSCSVPLALITCRMAQSGLLSGWGLTVCVGERGGLVQQTLVCFVDERKRWGIAREVFEQPFVNVRASLCWRQSSCRGC